VSERTWGRGVGSGYDANAAQYDDAARYNRLAAERLVASVPAGDHRRVLDVGCGTGFASLAMIARFGSARVTGVDLSAEMIRRFADKLAAEHPEVALEPVVADVLEMPVPDAAFDVVLCCMALHWFPDRPGALLRMARALRPGGVLALVAPGPDHDREFADLLRTVRPPVPAELYEAFDRAAIHPEPAERWLEEAGLEIVDLLVETRHRRVPPEPYLARIVAVGSHVIGHLSPAEQEDVRRRVETAVRASLDASGRWNYTFTKLYAIARRPG
jgi:ubiquinone/menaquinone biosynthesis C-methylase UbiE